MWRRDGGVAVAIGSIDIRDESGVDALPRGHAGVFRPTRRGPKYSRGCWQVPPGAFGQKVAVSGPLTVRCYTIGADDESAIETTIDNKMAVQKSRSR